MATVATEYNLCRTFKHRLQLIKSLFGAAWQKAVKVVGNSLDKLRHPRSHAYSAEQVLLNKQQILCGGAYPDCYRIVQPCDNQAVD